MTSLPVLEPATDDACCAPAGRPALGAEEAKQKGGGLQGPGRSEPAAAALHRQERRSVGESCVCDLTEPLDLGQPTVSHHLKILVDAGLLHREKRGTWAYFSLVPGALEHTAGLLASL